MIKDVEDTPQPRRTPREQPDEDYEPTISGVMRRVDVQRKQWGHLIVFIGVIGAGLLAVGAIASDRAESKVQNTNIRLSQQETALANHVRDEFEKGIRIDKRIDRQDDAQEVMNKKLTLLLDAAEVPRWKRPTEVPPAPKDGGGK